jgi:hypothetical protein
VLAEIPCSVILENFFPFWAAMHIFIIFDVRSTREKERTAGASQEMELGGPGQAKRGEHWTGVRQGVRRCRLPLLTNSALVYRVQMRGGGVIAGSQPMSAAVYIT